MNWPSRPAFRAGPPTDSGHAGAHVEGDVRLPVAPIFGQSTISLRSLFF